MTKKEVIRYRNCWMGFSILWVMFTHSHFGMPNAFLTFIKDIGFISVDGFLFASGLGCYYSLSKNDDILEFLKRRFVKLAPAYYLVIIPFILYKWLVLKVPFAFVWGNLTFMQSITTYGTGFSWYVTAIWIYYLLAPYMKKLIDRLDWKQNFGVIALLLVFSVAFWNTNTLIIIVARIPVVYLGMMLGKLDENYRFGPKQILVMEALVIPGLILIVVFKAFFPNILWTHGLYWYPSLLIVSAYCFNISAVLHLLRNSKFGQLLHKVLEVLGRNTFELFMVHIFIDDVLMMVYADHPNQRLVWIIGTLLIVPGVLLLKAMIRVVENGMEKIRSKRHASA